MNGFVKGALIGSVVAGIAGLLLAPKAGSELLDDIMETYDRAQKNGHDFITALKEKTAMFNGEAEPETHSSLVLGVVLGAVVSGIAALLLAPDSGKKMRKMIGNQYDHIRHKAEDFVSSVEAKGEKVIDEVEEWKDIFANLVNSLSAKSKHAQSNKANQIAELAKLGITLYQQLQKNRR